MSIDLGSLTTTFTPPNDCDFFNVEIDEPGATNAVTEISKYNLFWPSISRCFPSNYPTGYVVGADYYYSPGICLHGWTSFPDPTPATGSETRINCCPPGFTSATGLATSYGCALVVTAPTTVTAAVLLGTDFETYRTGLSAGSPITIATSTDYVIQPGTFLVDAFKIRYGKGDFTSPAPSTPVSSTTSSSTSSSSIPPTPAVNPADNSTTSGISSGAKIGIGVGIPIFAILLAIIGFFIFKRRRRTPAAPIDAPFVLSHSEKAELPGNAQGEAHGAVYHGKPELSTEPAATELAPTHSSASPPELDGQPRARPELDGRSRSRSRSRVLEEWDGSRLAELGTRSETGGGHATGIGVSELGTQTPIAAPVLVDNTSLLSPSPSKNHNILHTSSNSSIVGLPNPSSGGLAAKEARVLITTTERQPHRGEEKWEEDEEELRYQELRLKERRALLAERERLAGEEDALRDIRRARDISVNKEARNNNGALFNLVKDSD